MNTNTDFTAIKAEPDAHREDEEEMLHTEIDADNPDRQENYFVQHYENNRTAGKHLFVVFFYLKVFLKKAQRPTTEKYIEKS